MTKRRAARADVSTSSVDIVSSNGKCFMMFHNVLRVFRDVLLVVHDVLLVVHDVSRYITFYSVSRCFTMFSKSCNDRIIAWPPIASGITTTPQGSAITPQKSAMTRQGSSISLQK